MNIVYNMDYFFQLCRFGDVDAVEEQITDISDINMVNRIGDTPLAMAVLSGSKEMVSYLIENGANVNKHIRFQQTPLMLAVEEGLPKIVRVLLNSGADVNATDDDGDNALVYATFYCQEFPRQHFKDHYNYIIQMLITYGIDIYNVDDYGFSSLDNVPEHVKDEIISFHNSYKLRKQLILYRIQERAKHPLRQKIWFENGLNELGI